MPFLLRQAERGALKLGILYVSSVAKAALSVPIEIDSKPRAVNLADTIGVNSPAEPLDKMSLGDCNALYARAADWAVRQLASTPPPAREPTGLRHELAIFIQARRDHWQHQFFLPAQPSAIKPKLDCPEPALVLGYDLDGERLFQLLFGSDPTTVGQLLGLAFGADRPADPTYAPLRVRLVTDDSRLQVLPWGNIAYRGRPLVQDGWTVEFHAKCEPGFPEYSRHLCYFPGRVVLAGSEESRQAAHFHDLQRFFQRHWPENPDPARATDADALRAALQAGSTRLVYYYGPASREGLLLQDRADGECMPWPDFANWLKQSQSVSLLFLNLLGETGYEALLVRRRFHLTPRQPLLEGLLDLEATAGTTFCFLVLGWQAGKIPVNEAVLRAVADWCRSRLGAELGASGRQGKVRVISILALESEQANDLADTVERLIEEYDTEPGFHFGELESLAAVRRQDLRKYFRNETICGCDDRYRESFPDVLLAKRKEMPFDEAVATIRRGEPDNWGNLFDELTDMTNANPPAWPPPHYDPTFWSTRDDR